MVAAMEDQFGWIRTDGDMLESEDFTYRVVCTGQWEKLLYLSITRGIGSNSA
jgi:hypothetical protein